MRRLLIIVFVLLSNISMASTEKIEILDIKPTPFFPKVEKGESLKQIVQISINNSGVITPFQVKVSVGDSRPYYENIDTLVVGDNTIDVHVLDIEEELSVKFELMTLNREILAEKVIDWKPQKKWKVYYSAVSHQDMGFINYYQNLRRANREGGIDIALELCKQTDSWSENDQFRWNVETSEPIARWLSKQTPERVKEFERRIQEGRIEIAAIHNTISSQMAGYEVLARSFYTPNRYVIDKLNIEPAKVAIINDVTGISRTWPLFSKEAEVPYLMHGSNFPNCLNDLYDEPVFYWKSPDGDSENRTLCRTDSYYSPNKVKNWDIDGVSYLIDRHVDLDWEYDCILAYDSHDFADPNLDNAENIKAWNEKYAYPKIRCSVISSFFDDISQQLIPERVHETTKDAPDSWDDQDATDADLLGKARRVNYEIPTTEKFATIAMALSGGYPEKDIFQAYNRTIMYHEHTNGAINGGNHKHYETERVMHQTLIDEAVEFNRRALDRSLEKIGNEIKIKYNSMVIYNPLNWRRNEVVYFESDEIPFENFSLIDNSTNKSVEVQKLTNGKLAFSAENIPALGYKTYRIKEQKRSGFITSEICSDEYLENEYYKLKIDRERKIISELIDKKLNKNLIDKSSPYALGEYLHYDDNSKEWKSTEFTNIECFKGNLIDEIHISQKAYLTDKVELVIYLHHTTKNIEFDLAVNKLSNGEDLIGSWVRDLKEASFCAIPVDVPNYQHHHELTGAVTQPGNKDLQFESSESAYYAIQHFADVSNEDYGVTLSTIESPLVEYGYPRAGCWDSGARKVKEEIERPKSSSMFLYLMNNFFSTNVRVDQPGEKRFTFSINSHKGNWKEGEAYKFAWESSHPILSQVIEKNREGTLEEEREFLTVDRDNVVCSTLKMAEANGSGFILRFFELEGKKSNVKIKLDLNQKIDKAYATSLIENDLSELTVDENGEVEFEINGHGIKTIRLLSTPDKISEVKTLTVTPISDAEVNLSWVNNSSTSVSHFNIYRSTFAECEPTRLNLIGTAEEDRYLDKTELNFGGWGSNRLDENSSYYYRVASVDMFNNEGEISEVVKCTTLDRGVADAKPIKVQGVYTVHVSPLAPENFINLWFYTNFEKDVDKYMIHRGEIKDFTPSDKNLINTLIPSKDSITFSKRYSKSELNRQMYADKTAEVNRTYYYKVCAVDNNGQRGEYSDPAFASMESAPVTIISKRVDCSDFKDFRSEIKFEIECSTPDCQIMYSLEDPAVEIGAVKYSGEFSLSGNSLIHIAGFKANEDEPLFRYSKFKKVSLALSQSDWAKSYGADMAIDNSKSSQWVSKPYGGETEANPSDIWLGVNLESRAKIRGVKVFGDEREMMPIIKDFEILIKRDGELIEIDNLVIKADSIVKNSYEVDFGEDISADGVMILFDKDNLPKSDLPDQDGVVRICELEVIASDI